MYFRLINNVFSIGEKNVILYDISMQRYFMLDRRGSRAINACESNSRIEDIPVNQFKLKRFLDILAEKKIGKYFDTIPYVEKNIPYSPYVKVDNFELKKVYFDIRNKCDLNCKYCNEYENKISFGCQTCISTSQNCEDQLDIEKIGRELGKYEIPHLVIRSGNPFFDQKKLVELINLICPKRLTIVCNGLEINNEILQKLKENVGIIDFVITFLGADEDEYSSLGINKSIIKRQIETLEQLKKWGYEFTISIITTKNIAVNKMPIFEYMSKEFFANICVCRKQNTNINGDITPNRYLNFSKNNMDFLYKRRYNWCMNGTIAIQSNGVVQVCPMMKKKLGNLKIESLYNIFSNEKIYSEYWEKTKNMENSCEKCGLKYFCNTCQVTDDLLPMNEISLPICEFDDEKAFNVIKGFGVECINF